MDLQFDFKGDPVGGQIMTCKLLSFINDYHSPDPIDLLEKSRVVQQAPGERSFHIFYQLIKTPDEKLRSRLFLSKLPSDYDYLKGGNCETVNGVDDAKEFIVTQKAMHSIGIIKPDQEFLFEMLAAILHLGNIKFEAADSSSSKLTKNTQQCMTFNDKMI